MKHIIVLATFIFGLSAHAGFMLEPFASSDTGASKATLLSTVDASTKSTGMSYGARLGYRFMNGISVGGEYTTGTGTVKDDSGSATPFADTSYARVATGAFVGFDHGMFRAWFGYGISDVFTSKFTAGDTKTKGTNMKLGIGVMPIHHLSINFEYIIPKYTTSVSAAGTETDISASYSKFDTSMMAIGISAPFDFGNK